MKRVFLQMLGITVIAATIHAEPRQLEVRGLEHSPKSDQKGFSVILLDSHSDEQLVSGLASIPPEFGSIESAVLIVADDSGKRLCRVPLISQKLDDKATDYEFHLRRDLLKSSYLAVSHRAGDDLYVAKIILGSFYVRESTK